MFNPETNIDTVALQMDFYNAEEQRIKLNLLCKWIVNRQLSRLEVVSKNSSKIMKYDLYCKTKIATIHSGATRVRDKFTGKFKKLYYIRIRFAGLKSFDNSNDAISINCLMTICAYLNTTGTTFRLSELDIAIDVLCPFENILVCCTKESANVPYNPLGYTQYFQKVPTTYIENYADRLKKRNAVLRAYVYNKGAKENLPVTITRFELKLQNRFFINNPFNITSIMNTMNRYSVMYFENLNDKYNKINQYHNYVKVTSREINRLNFNQYRLFPDSTVLNEFIYQVNSVYIDFNGNVAMNPSFNTCNPNFFSSVLYLIKNKT